MVLAAVLDVVVLEFELAPDDDDDESDDAVDDVLDPDDEDDDPRLSVL